MWDPSPFLVLRRMHRGYRRGTSGLTQEFRHTRWTRTRQLCAAAWPPTQRPRRLIADGDRLSGEHSSLHGINRGCFFDIENSLNRHGTPQHTPASTTSRTRFACLDYTRPHQTDSTQTEFRVQESRHTQDILIGCLNPRAHINMSVIRQVKDATPTSAAPLGRRYAHKGQRGRCPLPMGHHIVYRVVDNDAGPRNPKGRPRRLRRCRVTLRAFHRNQ